MSASSRLTPLIWGTAFVVLNALLAFAIWRPGGWRGVVGPAGIELVTPHVEAPAILSSEADQIAIAARVDARLTFKNWSDREQLLSVGKTGCSCYGISTKQFLLEPGEWIKIPPRATKDLFFVAREIQGETEQAFRVRFHVGDAVDVASTTANAEITATGSMKIVRDLTLDPSSIIMDCGPGGPQGTEDAEFPIVLRQVTRGRHAVSPPTLVMDPALLKAKEFQSAEPPQEIAPGLWQVEWRTSFSPIALPDSVRENGGRFVFSVEFEESPPRPAAAGRSRRDGSVLPTLLDVVQDEPERRVSGQLVIRRSRGVVAPGQIHFGSILPGEHRERRIVLTAVDKTPFVVEVDRVPASFRVAVDSKEPATQQWVTVTLTGGATGDVNETLQLRTSHPDQPEARVELQARVRLDR